MMPDREKIKTGIFEMLQRDTWKDIDKERHRFQPVLNDALALLKKQEVKTGKWIEQTDCLGDTYYDCSVCNESWITIEGTPWVNGMNYCPHCGAKMEFEGSVK